MPSSSSDAVVIIDAGGQSLFNSLFSWFGSREEVGSMGSGCGSCDNVEEEGLREESCSVSWFCIVVVIGIGISSRSKRFSVGSVAMLCFCLLCWCLA